MNRVAASIGLMVALLAPGACAQSAAVPPACPTPSTLDELTKALDDAVSGPRDKDRTCLRDLLLPEARMTPVRKEQDGSFHPRHLTVDDWIKAVSSHPGPPFYEKQIKVSSETYGHFAHLWSTYEIRSTSDGKAEVKGINSIQAVYDGKSWRILSILWESDATAGPVPEKYLP